MIKLLNSLFTQIVPVGNATQQVWGATVDPVPVSCEITYGLGVTMKTYFEYRYPLLEPLMDSQCNNCANLSTVLPHRCSAFPAGIPSDIALGEHDHTVSFVGDRGILFREKKKFPFKRERVNNELF